MKLNSKKISINYLLDQFIILQYLIHLPLLAFFKLVRLLSKIITYDQNCVMVISLNRLGDTIFTIPAVQEIQNKYGNEFIIVCLPGSAPIYRLMFDQAKIYEIDRNDFYLGNRIAKPVVKRKLKKLKPSLIFDLTGSMVSASLIFNVRAKQVIGINGNQFKTLYDQFIKFRKTPKLTDIYLDAVSPIIEITEPENKIQNNISINLEGRVLIHPFAGWKEKEWNLKNFLSLAQKIYLNHKVCLVIQTGQICQDVLNEIKNLKIEVIESKSVDHLIECIKGCSLFIGNDSGPVNVAKFLGKPTYTIYGATNPDYTEMGYEHQLFIQKKLNCSAEKNNKFCIVGGMIYSCSGVQCMNLINVEEVYNHLLPLLKKYCQMKSS